MTRWPKNFPLRRIPQQDKVSPLVTRKVCLIPDLTVVPLGERAKKSLRKCCIRLWVLMGWPRVRLRESVITSEWLPLSMQTPRCRCLVKEQDT